MKQEETKKTNDEVSLEEFELLLSKHDWYYMMSEDIRVFNRGSYNRDKLSEISRQSDEHRKLYEGYRDKYKIT